MRMKVLRKLVGKQKTFFYGLVILVGILLVVICVGSPSIVDASAGKLLLKTGNSFFGGSMPYSLTMADYSYRTALLFDPKVEDAWHQRARIAFLKGNFDDALVKINKQIDLHGDSFMAAYYIRGLIYGYDKQYTNAEKDFLHFLTWDSNNWAANNDLAWIYFAQGKFDQALAQSAKGLAVNPGNAWLLTMHAMSLYNLGKSEKAYEELLEAKKSVEKLTEADWTHSYPGNDPAIAASGLAAFKATIEKNIELVHKALPTR